MLLISIKKFFANWMAPVPVVVILLTFAVLLLWSSSKRRQTSGKVFATIALFMLVLFSSPYIADQLLEPFETRYAIYRGEKQQLEYVVVLGCSHSSNDAYSITSEVHPCSIVRLMEGIRIVRLHPEAKLILSGYGGSDPFSNAEMMKRLIDALEIKDLQLILEPNPRDTGEEARLLKRYLINSEFALVTSASHMPRAMNFFVQQGLTPTAAPTHHMASDYSHANWWEYAPSATQLRKSERALYETMGTIWQQISN